MVNALICRFLGFHQWSWPLAESKGYKNTPMCVCCKHVPSEDE